MSVAERGASLAEMIVVIAVTATIGAMATGAITATSSAVNTALTTTQQIRDAGITMTEIGRVVHAASELPIPAKAGQSARFAPAVSEASGSTLTLYSYINLTDGELDPVQSRFTVDGDELTETVTRGAQDEDGYWHFTGRAETRVLAAGLTASPFAFLDAAGSELTAFAAGSSSEDDRARIRSVVVDLRLAHPSGRQKVDIRNSFTMYNLSPWTAPS